jgi:hypothetical protein
LKLNRLLAVFVITTLLVTFIPLPHASASQAYSEKLSVSIAGSDALWYMTFTGVNVTSTIASAETSVGIDSYNLTVLKTTGWTLDSQSFGPNGYNLIPVPFIPSQGAFLSIVADTFSHAAQAALAFDSVLFTSFMSYSNGTGAFIFYSTISFTDIVPTTLLTLIPTNMGGFASALSAPTFASSQSPIVILQGQNTASGFSHALTLGSISTSALSTASTPNFLRYFGTTITALTASNKSSGSTIDFKLLDGTIISSDNATLASNSYSRSLSPGQSVASVNLTASQIPTTLFVQRVFDKGVLMPNQNVSVTLSLSNSQGESNATTVSFKDDWWKPYGFFKLVDGNSTIPSQVVAAGDSVNPTYILQYTGGTPQQVTVPPTSVEYSYTLGARTFRAQALSNPITLSLGSDAPVVYAYLSPSTSGSNYGEAIGKTQQVTVLVKNIGTLTASSVVVAGQQQGGLVAGASVGVPISLTPSSLASVNFTKTYTVTYSTPGGQAETVETNPIPVYFSHTAMTYGLPSLSLQEFISHPETGPTNLTLVFTAQTKGSVGSTSFLAKGTLPSGLGCGEVLGANLTCAGRDVTLSIPTLGTDPAVSSMQFNLSSPANYFFPPIPYHAQNSGLNLTGASDGVVAPAGIVLSKQFSPTGMFGNMTSVVEINALNTGPFHVFNATIASAPDIFDSLSPTYVSTRFLSDVSPGSNLNQTYHVIVSKSSQALGNWTSSPVSLSFFIGGTSMSLNSTGPAATVYQVPSVTVKTSPASPVEGKSFSVSVSLANPSAVAVSDVRYEVQIPTSATISGLRNATYSAGSLVMTVDQLPPHQTFSANITVQAASGTTLPFSKGSLTFAYLGVTVHEAGANHDVVVGEDVLLRYAIPTLLVLVAVLATAFYVRRKAAISLGSQR